jgi:hypothetical protein
VNSALAADRCLQGGLRVIDGAAKEKRQPMKANFADTGFVWQF